MLTSGFACTDVSEYHDLRYRIGVYRLPAANSREELPSQLPIEEADARLKYGWKTLSVVAAQRLLRLRRQYPFMFTPNDMAIHTKLKLIHVV
jgi:hypothetical protein